MSDHALAARLATEAGQLLLRVRDEFADAEASERKAAGDKRSHDFLVEALSNERPGDAVLSEEGADDPVRLRSERVWIVDPLDGTREVSALGRDDWAGEGSYLGDASARRASRGAGQAAHRGLADQAACYRAGRSRCAGRHTGRNGF